jgi:hypothetical protein
MPGTKAIRVKTDVLNLFEQVRYPGESWSGLLFRIACMNKHIKVPYEVFLPETDDCELERLYKMDGGDKC